MDSPAEAFTLAADRLSAAKARLEESEAAAAAASEPSAAARGEDETRAAFGDILAGLGSDIRDDILAALSPELQRTLVDNNGIVYTECSQHRGAGEFVKKQRRKTNL